MLIENRNLNITKNIDELKNAITEKEKEIQDILKQMKNFN
jgi:prefoldin subunit 5